MARAPTHLTFGIEFEFLLASVPHDFPYDPDPTDPRPARFPSSLVPDYEDIAAVKREDPTCYDSKDFIAIGPCAQNVAFTLNANGLPAYPWFRDKYEDPRYRASEHDLAGWCVKTDASVRLKEDEEDEGTPFCTPDNRPSDPYEYLGLEVTSPVLTRHFTGSATDDADLEKVARAAWVLKRGFRTWANWSTGLHVHVGNGEDGFDIRTLQKLMAFLYAFEPGIEKVHAPRRRNKTTGGYCTPLRSGLKAEFRREKGWVVIDEIMKQTNVRDLGRLLDGWGGEKGEDRGSTNKFCAYNLRNLVSGVGGVTVEFRQHDGTLDGAEAVRWAGFCTRVVAWCMGTTWTGVRTYCLAEMERQEGERGYMGVGRICEVIGYEEGRRAWEVLEKGEEEEEEGLEMSSEDGESALALGEPLVPMGQESEGGWSDLERARDTSPR